MNSKNHKRPSLAFSWNGLPQYAARLLRAAIDAMGGDVPVIGSKPGVPVTGMDDVLRQPVYWVDAKSSISWHDLGLNIPDIFVQSGWSYPAFSALGREVKAHGGKVIGLSDANWRGDFRQLILGPLCFRLKHRKYFDAMIVPGRQGHRLMCYFGMPEARVKMGMYGADPALFGKGEALDNRPKTILYVGQFIARKDVLGLARAFIKFHRQHPDWTLRLCGSGPQRDALPDHHAIIVEDFVQPEELAQRYRNARFFVLPSHIEAWGLVVHEAALCGCGLILSNAIGSADDLATPKNAICFSPGDEGDMARALSKAARLDEVALRRAEIESRNLAANFGPERFARTIETTIKAFD